MRTNCNTDLVHNRVLCVCVCVCVCVGGWYSCVHCDSEPCSVCSKPRPRLFLCSSSSPRLFMFPLPSCSVPLLPVIFPPVYLFLFKLRQIFMSWLNVCWTLIKFISSSDPNSQTGNSHRRWFMKSFPSKHTDLFSWTNPERSSRTGRRSGRRRGRGGRGGGRRGGRGRRRGGGRRGGRGRRRGRRRGRGRRRRRKKRRKRKKERKKKRRKRKKERKKKRRRRISHSNRTKNTCRW